MNKKRLIIIICLFLVFMSTISFACAVEDVESPPISTSVVDNSPSLQASDTQNDILTEGSDSFSELDSLVQNAEINASVELNNNYTYSDSDVALKNGIIINKNITIDGKGYAIDGANIASIFNITNNAHVILKNIVFKNARGTNGSAISLTSSESVEIIESTFINNSASLNGGAIYIASAGSDITSSSTIRGSTFINNSAITGGAIYINANLINILSSTFNFNNASLDGGAVYVDGDFVYLIDSNFTNNTAGDDGGALYWNGDNGIIDNIICMNNKGISADKSDGDTSSTRGGTICLTGSSVILSNSLFTQSSAYMDEGKDSSKVDGGALFVTGNDVNITNTKFNYCTAINGGGALYIIGNNTQINNCDFDNCNASDGAALYVEGIGCKLYNTSFENNIAGDDGGAIYWQGSNGIITNITCINNKGISANKSDGDTSSTRGGTICLTGSNVTISESTFSLCQAYMDSGKNSSKVDGGALFITGDDVSVIGCEFDRCVASNNGGSIYIIGNDVNILNSIFDNSTALNGGAIYVAGTNANINASKFKTNKASQRGGSIFVEGDGASIINSTIDNTQSLIGGAIYISGNSTFVDGCSFNKNTGSDDAGTGGSGGAIYVDGDYATIINSDFSYGIAVNYGGAISVWGKNANITSNTFENCSATSLNGGAIYVEGTNATIALSNFTNNKVNTKNFAHGGAIDIEGSDSKVLNCNFEESEAYVGGFIYLSGSNCIIDGSSFKEGTAVNGGSIYVSGVNASISGSDFSSIVSEMYGGAIYVEGDYANISENTFEECSVKTYHGGAIYIAGEYTNVEKSNFTLCTGLSNVARGGAIDVEGHYTVIKESNFNQCSAIDGGDIYVFGNYVRIENSSFDLNTARSGGAIYLYGWGAVIDKANITDCNASRSGGAIYVAGGGTYILESNIENCLAKGSDSSNGGGAIYVEGPDTHIATSNFNNNKVTNNNLRGGTIYIKGARTFIEESNFNNSFSGQGGIIYIEGEDTIINSSTFANSSSINHGGAIYVNGHNATIEWSVFENIYSKQNGGAIFVDGESTDILYSRFDNCTVSGNLVGGAIYIDDIETTVAYSNFTNSKAAVAGAIYIQGENTTISYCNLDNNTAGSAGAIKVSGDDTIISNCNLTNNIATSLNGGALDIEGDNAGVYYSWFDHNDAKGDGGAINWVGGHGDDSIIGCTFTNNNCNETMKGGGAIFWSAGDVISSGGLIEDCIFINNTASGRHGGAIDWFRALDSVINNCLFINNYASSDGGALYTGDQGGNSHNLTISNCQFYNNSARKHGGAIANQMSDSWVYNNTFDGNTAGFSGGSILMKEGPAVNSVIDHCYIYNSFCNQTGDKYGNGGGSIHIADRNITISNCAIINSTVNITRGGAILSQGADCSLVNVTIQNVETISGNGGAIFWEGKNGYLNNVTIFNSSSNANYNTDANGGAIYLSGTYCNLNNISITTSSSNAGNSSKSANGGAIYVLNTNNVNNNILTNVIIDDSKSTSDNFNSKGGAIYWGGKAGTLINATISNTLSNGEGGAIYWSGGSPKVENISISYSQTKVVNSTKDASGGAIYSTSISDLTNVYIVDSLASTTDGNIYGGAIYFNGNTMNNVTVIGSRATTDSGTSYGGAVYWKKGSTSNAYIYNSSFNENNADLGGSNYFNGVTARVYNTSFIGNVANFDGGAMYNVGGDALLYNATFELNSAKRGGAIFAQNVQIKIYDSSFRDNTAENQGGAIYRNTKSGSSEIINTDLVNNTAFQGSAIFTLSFFTLKDVILLDNQANSNKFINKVVGVDEEGNNYTSAVFVGFDNLLNGIWCESDSIAIACTNVIYWSENGIDVCNSKPKKSDREAGQNVTVEMYDHNGEFINSSRLLTDSSGAVKYVFNAKNDEVYYFAYIHESDRYYTYLRDTLSNSTIVKIYVNDFYYGNSTTVSISLTDGAWGSLSGNVTVTFNDTGHTNFTVEVINGTYVGNHTFDLPVGLYNATAKYEGNITTLGDTDSNLFRVMSVDDLEISKSVNTTADTLNVSEIIEYVINVTNHGPTRDTGVNVTEILSPYLLLLDNKTSKGNYDGTTWHIGDLDVNETVTLTITAQIIHRGPITNTVWVIGDGFDTNMSNNIASAHNFTAIPIVDLSIVKKINITDTVNVTDIIEYTITVFNDGPSDATGVVVGEVLDHRLKMISNNPSVGSYSNGTWNVGRLDKGANATLTIIAEVIYSGNITNAVNVTSYENDTNLSNNYYNITTLAKAYVDLQITKKANQSVVNVTDIIEFTISVYNDGPANASGVYVSEILGSNLKLISSNVTIGRYDGATWVIGTLNKGEVHNLTIVAQVTSEGDILNVVNITGADIDTDLTNNKDNVSVTVLPIVDLEISKDVNVSGYVNVTDKIKFTITVKNNGPCDASGVNVTEVLSPHLKLTSNTTDVGYYDGKIWHIGDLASYSSVVLTLVCEVISNGTISNVVSVTSNENDTNKLNNNDTIDNITALPIVDVMINKTVNITTGALNLYDYLEFNITIYNAGPCNATGVYVSEILHPSLKVLSAHATKGVYDNSSTWGGIDTLNVGESATLTIVAQVMYSGLITNEVTVYSYEKDTNISNNKDNISRINVTTNVDLEIFKTVNVSGFVNVSDIIEFNITVHEKLRSPASGVYVSEILSPHLRLISANATRGDYDGSTTWNVGYLDGGESATLTIVAQVISNGTISNVVVVYGYDNDTNMSNNNDSIENITALPIVDLQITKKVDTESKFVNVSDIIQFTVDVFNNGPSDATNVTVSEVISPHLKVLKVLNSTGYYNVTSGIWHIGNLVNQSSAQLIIQAQVISNGTISNVVVVTSNENDTNKSNNKDSIANITALPIVDLEISKTVTASTVNVTDRIEFTITVKNNGPCNATGVNVSEILNKSFKLINNVTKDGYYNVTEGIWYIGNLKNNSTAVLTLVCNVTLQGTISNYVEVSSYENDSNIYNNWDEKTITALPIVDVSINKSSNASGEVNMSDLIEFTVTIYNSGPCNATGVYVSEVLHHSLRLVSAKATKGVYDNSSTWSGIDTLNVGESATLTIVARVVYSLPISNEVIVYSAEKDTNLTNNHDNISYIYVSTDVDLEISKSVNVSGFVNVTDKIEFNITVHNKHTNNASGVYVSEVLSPHLKLISANATRGSYDGSTTWNIGYLNGGESVTLTIVAQVISNGTISNVVVVYGYDNDTNMSNNNDSIENITALPIVDLQITKDVDVESKFVNVSDEIQFTIVVKNNGPCDATNVTVNEVLSPLLNMTSYSTWIGNYNVTTGVWYIGNLPSKSTVFLVIKAQVLSNGTITNTVNVTSNENDTDKSNNNDSIDNITALPVVDLAITKVSNTTGPVNVTDLIEFTITVTNNGPCNATQVIVNETLDSALKLISFNASKGTTYEGNIWIIGNLSVGDTKTLNITARVDYSGLIKNEVVVTSYENDTDLSNNKASISEIISHAIVDLVITKESNVSGVVNVSDYVEFTINVTNNGPSNASGVYVLESLDSHLAMVSYNVTKGTYDNYTWIIGYLNYNETVTLTIVAQVISNGTIANVVTVNSFDNDTNKSNNNDSIDNITALPIVDLEITKYVDVESKFVNVSDIIQFTITVRNNGPSDATNVVVSEVLSPYLNMTDYLIYGGNYNVTSGIWYIGDLANQSSAQLIIQAQVISNGTISNVVVVTSNENDTNKSNNNASIDNITALPIVDLEITKLSNISKGVVNVTDMIEYTITVVNHGPSNATNVNVSEVLSSYLKLIKNETNIGYYNYTGGYWYIGNLSVNSSAVLTIVVQALVNGTIDNEVVVSSFENDTNPYNNWAEIIIEAKSIVDISINKSSNVTGEMNITDNVEFTIVVHNAGPSNATGVYVSEVLSPYLKFISCNASVGSYDGFTWTIGDLANGSSAKLVIVAQAVYSGLIENVVVVNSFETDTNESNNRDDISPINVTAHADLEITKKSNVTGIINVSDFVEFNITVRNNVPSNASGVYVLERLDPHLRLVSYDASVGEYDNYTWNIGFLDKGETAKLTIVAQVISNGTIANVVTVNSFDNDTNQSNNNASIDNITALPVVDLEITKDVDVESRFVNVSDIIQFTITVKNNGPCDATNVMVSEVLSPYLNMTDCLVYGGYYNVTSGIWYIGDLANKSSAQLIIQAQVISNGTISNVVVVTSNENDTNKSNNEASIDNITALPIVDLDITKEVNVTLVNVTDMIEYTITVVNHGPSNATDVNVSEVLSSYLKLIKNVTNVGYYNYTGGYWYIGNLSVNSTAVLTIVVQAVVDGTIDNEVVVSSFENDTNPYDNWDETFVEVKPLVDVSISKSSNVTGEMDVGDNVEFTIVVHNAGPSNATGVYVSEVLSPYLKFISCNASAGSYDGFTWTIGDLANASTVKLVIVAQAVYSGLIENAVVVNSFETDTNKSNNNASIDNITALPVVDLEITKDVDVESSFVNIYDIIQFTITVRNNGPYDATNVMVSEVLSPYLNMAGCLVYGGNYNVTSGIWYIGDLANQSSAQLIIQAQVISNGTISNVVVVTSNENDTNKSNNEASIDNITALPVVDLVITKKVNVTLVNVSDLIEYTITVLNNGPSNASDVVVSEVLSNYVEFVKCESSLGTYDPSTGIWGIDKLQNGSKATLLIIVRAISNGTVENVVSVNCRENTTVKNATSENVTVLPIVDVKVNKTVSVTQANVGDDLTYTITVHNNGPSDATDVNVTENLSNYVTFVEYTASQGNYDANKNIWYIGKLTNGSTQTLTLTVRIIKGGIIENSVVVKSNENDTNITNNKYTSENVTAEKINTPIDLSTYNITYGDIENLITVLPRDATGVVNITVGDRTYYNVPIVNGIAELPVDDLAAGDYNVTVVYGGDDKYLPNSTAGIFNVAKVTPIITIEVEDIWVGEVEILNVTVNAPGVVFVTVNGVTVEIPLDNGVITTGLLAASIKTEYKGNATWNIWGLPVGPYPAFALYPGNENYTSVNTSSLFHVRDLPSTVVVTADDIYVGEDAVIKIIVGPKGVSGNVTVNVDGKNYTVGIDDEGKATLIVPNLKAGQIDVHVYYNGTEKYLPSEDSTTFNVLKVKPTVNVDAPEIYVGEDGVITVTVPDDATGTITIEIEGERYTAEIKDGQAIFIVPGLQVGVHDIKAYYSGDDKYLPANVTGVIKVNPKEDNQTDIPEHHDGINLSLYPTGNPIFVLLLVILSIGSVQLRKFKK